MREKFFIFDGYSLIYRGYYALMRSPRITSYGLDTSAIYGFVNIFLDIIDKEKPDYIAVAFETQTFKISKSRLVKTAAVSFFLKRISSPFLTSYLQTPPSEKSLKTT